MLYAFGKVIMWTTLHFYFRRIIFAGKNNIPDGEPVILIANHSASFLDAMLLAVQMKRHVHFYARSDIFRKDWANKILRSFHMIPIYNIEHGKQDLQRNQETFAEGEQVLIDKGLLLIFPEGTSRVERIMLPLKKGTARVALQTESKADFTLGLKVIPVGINYSDHRFRADIHIQVGEPTSIRDYEPVFKENPNKAITQLTRELETKFSDTIIYVVQPDRTKLINRLLELYRNDTFHPLDHLRAVPILKMEKGICGKVSEMSEAEAAEKMNELNRYDNLLKSNGLMDSSINGRYYFIAVHLLLLIIGLPLFLTSLLLNAVPLRFAKWIADTKVTRIDFYTSVANASGGFGYFLWWMILFIVAAIIGKWWVWLVILLAPVMLFLGMFWWEGFQSFLCHSRYLFLKWKKSSILTELIKLRNQICFWEK
jgi:glycerol-3-phosphate O-acyltransferase / dihydroxyacetone phosphate acyltransferase